MYKVFYQRQNGEIIERIRNTLPHYKLGETTSMGWIIVDIHYLLDNKYYPFREYRIKLDKQIKRNHVKRKIIKYIKKYVGLVLYFPMILFFIK